MSFDPENVYRYALMEYGSPTGYESYVLAEYYDALLALYRGTVAEVDLLRSKIADDHIKNQGMNDSYAAAKNHLAKR